MVARAGRWRSPWRWRGCAAWTAAWKAAATLPLALAAAARARALWALR
eukprot:CAMPEP_0180804748 /NCGR_PEP_ID=MMETSP1038_2-20121128/61630_1 /TAXON_ID=632150 /ORGANISM="Azadinium spinosum, Strain 3D9" /LENGTH=47 /DNA_ID= /DNA_START= /DNA_END= /DNA_ORIENTATION=